MADSESMISSFEFVVVKVCFTEPFCCSQNKLFHQFFSGNNHKYLFCFHGLFLWFHSLTDPQIAQHTTTPSTSLSRNVDYQHTVGIEPGTSRPVAYASTNCATDCSINLKQGTKNTCLLRRLEGGCQHQHYACAISWRRLTATAHWFTQRGHHHIFHLNVASWRSTI